MEFSWSTFIFEIINFLILVLILKYFLYKPVLKIIAERKAGIQKDLDDAQTMRDESLKLQQQYGTRLQDWQQEKEQSRNKLHEEIVSERERLMQELNLALQQEKQKAEVIKQRQLKESSKIAQQLALRQGARFAAALLSRLASPELESHLFELLLQDLAALPEGRQEFLRSTDVEQEIIIISGYELTHSKREKLEETLYQLIETRLKYRYQTDPQLLAGLRIVFGPWILHANLQDELQFFTESVHD